MIIVKPSGAPDRTLPSRGAVVRSVRKVALCGSHSSSLRDAPWSDPSWEFWGHASSRDWYCRVMDRYFDLHPQVCWTRGGKKGTTYPQWLASNTVPIYMQDRFSEVPASVKYPRGRVLQEFGGARPYFTNHVAWMIALALTEGVTTLGLFGVNYGAQSEYMTQRGSAEYWLGRAEERGVRLVFPEQCTLLRDPALLYGYESHDEQTGELRQEYKPRFVSLPQPNDPRPATITPELRAEIEEEETKYTRPPWALGPMNGAAQGEA